MPQLPGKYEKYQQEYWSERSKTDEEKERKRQWYLKNKERVVENNRQNRQKRREQDMINLMNDLGNGVVEN